MIKNINKIIFFSLIFSFLLPGTDGTVRGKITDEKGDPLPGQVVVLNDLGDVVTGTAAEVTPVSCIAEHQFKVCDLIIGLNESYQKLVRKKKAA